MTNKFNLPEQVVKALSADSYSAGSSDYSVTTLLKPAQMVMLERRHGHAESDVVDKLWSVFGTAVHNIMEDSEDREDAIVEKRFYIDVLGRKVGGMLDHFYKDTISDYKCTSVYKVKSDDHFEWEAQQNIYAYILRQHGYTVSTLQIVAILRDWSGTGHLRDKNYPASPVTVVTLPLWEDSVIEDYLHTQVQALLDAETLADEDLLPCQDADMWYTGSKYAVMKGTNKRATKLFDDPDDAFEYAMKLGTTYWVQDRPGEYKRCDKYCPVASKCLQKAER